MIESVFTGNFKAFEATQSLPIKPLTLIYGPNSSGKSSLIQSLIFATEAMKSGKLDMHTTQIGGQAVDLGGFRQFIHRSQPNRQLEWGVELNCSSMIQHERYLSSHLAKVKSIKVMLSVGIALDDYGQPLSEAEPVVEAYEYSVDRKIILRMNREHAHTLTVTYINHLHPIFANFVQDGSSIDKLDQLPKEGIEETRFEESRQQNIELAIGCEFELDGLLPIKLSKSSATDDLNVKSFKRFLNDLVASSTRVIKEELANLQYLGPLRSFPSRHLAFADHGDTNWLPGGGYAWDVVRKNASVRKKVNEWLGSEILKTPYELAISQSVRSEDFRKLFANIDDTVFIDEDQFEDDDLIENIESTPFLDYLENKDQFLNYLNKAGVKVIEDLVLIDKRSETWVSHRDVGIGISQVLPVLVLGFASQNKIIAMEQPEIHLHPALQAELGDVFINSAVGANRNRFLIETHSEHLLLRMMRRMRETYESRLPEHIAPLRPEDIVILYVEPDGARSIVREMPLNGRGELVKAWPGGFFEEGLREIF